MHLVVFDIDGTLTQTDSIDDVCYVAAVSEVLSIPGIDTDWTSYPHVTDSGILRQAVQSSLGRDVLSEEMDRVCRCFHGLLEDAFRRQPESCLPVEGGPEMIRQLAARSDMAVALATGGWESTARLKLERAGYDILDIPLASSSDADSREEIMRIAERRARDKHGVPGFDTITYVGDGVWDARAAASLGWRFLGVGTGEQAARLEREGAFAVIGHYSSGSFLR
jgi:phosphoglycolate phosphatase-like HAD superfamily hydrolase